MVHHYNLGWLSNKTIIYYSTSREHLHCTVTISGIASNLCRTVTLPTSACPHLRRLAHLCNNFWLKIMRQAETRWANKKQNNTTIAVEDFVPSWASWVSHFKVAPGLLGLLLHLYSTCIYITYHYTIIFITYYQLLSIIARTAAALVFHLQSMTCRVRQKL